MTTANEESPNSQQESELLDNKTPNESIICKAVVKENHKPVLPFSSGEGLPYAPEGWPNPGDIWIWKVGKRTNSAGYYVDRFLTIPKSLEKADSRKRTRLISKSDVERFIKSNFPSMDLEAFFAMFSWKVPSSDLALTKDLETGNEVTEGIPIRKKRKQKAQLNRLPVRKSPRTALQPTEQEGDGIIYLGSTIGEMPLAENAKLTPDSESDQPSNDNNVSSNNNIVGAYDWVVPKEGSDMQTDMRTTPEKSMSGIVENFDDYLNSLEDILVLPTETPLSDPAEPNTPAPENEMAECRKKLSTFLAMDFPSLVSSNNIPELARLASQLRKDPSLTIDELIKLKLVEEIPLIGEAFLEAKGTIEQADKFFADLESKKVEVTRLRKDYNEMKDTASQLQSEIDSSTLAIQEIDDHISKLQSKREEMWNAHGSMLEKKAALTSTQTTLANSIPAIVSEIQLAHVEIPKWELKKGNSIQREAEILNRFSTLRGFSF